MGQGIFGDYLRLAQVNYNFARISCEGSKAEIDKSISDPWKSPWPQFFGLRTTIFTLRV